MTTLGLKNINMLSKEQYDTVEDPVREELWAVETETYSDDDGNWYRVYPDGWCEQGGKYTGASSCSVNLLKVFSSTNYSIVISGTAKFTSKTTTSFVMDTNAGYSTKYNGSWEARGYIA